jgi:23S rRNA G2445 N2-methylase RlmL
MAATAFHPVQVDAAQQAQRNRWYVQVDGDQRHLVVAFTVAAQVGLTTLIETPQSCSVKFPTS